MAFTLKRKPFGLLLAAVLLAVLFINLAVVRNPELAGVGWLWLVPTVSLVIITIMRLRDIGWSAWWAVLGVVPVGGLAFGAYLCTRATGVGARSA